MTRPSAKSGRAERRRTNVIPDPQNKWLVDVKLQCCGAVIEDVRTDSKTDSTDTASGNGPTHGVCPDCGNWMVPFEYQNVRRLHEWCDDCEVWYLADEGHECEPELVADGGEEVGQAVDQSKWTTIKNAALAASLPGIVATSAYVTVLLTPQLRPDDVTAPNAIIGGVIVATALFLIIALVAKVAESGGATNNV